MTDKGSSNRPGGWVAEGRDDASRRSRSLPMAGSEENKTASEDATGGEKNRVSVKKTAVARKTFTSLYCRHLPAMSDQRYIKEGWLLKRSRSGRVVSNWRRRYFRLTRTELLYYKTPQDSAPRRRYELTLDTSVLRTNDQGYPLCIVFQPAPGQASFYMQAENEVEKDEWITAIYNAYRRTPDVAQQTLPSEMQQSESAPSIGPTPPQPPPAPAAPSRILLKLVVEEARKLKAADFNGKSDPYCIVKLVGKDGQIIDVEEKRTEVIPATLEPVWRKPFEIGRVVDLNSVKAIRFDLFDHDTFKHHDNLGSVQVPFSRFRMSPASTAQSEPIDDWFRVEPPKKTGLSSSPRRNDTREKEHVVKDWGELRVQMSISGPNLVDFFHSSELAFVPSSPVATASSEHTDNRLEVTVIAARDLISADLNNSSDPYCELSLLDDHGRPIPGEYATTAIMHRTRNPAWADEHHVFGLICHIEKAASLKVRVVDFDKSNRNDPLGFVLIGLDQLSAHKWTEWHALQPEEGMSVRENLGEIQLKIWLIGERRGEHARQLKIEKELNSKRHSISVEQLELENAQFQLYDAACKLDGARIPCAVTDYQSRDPRFYGINGCIHYLNSQIPRAHQEKMSSDEGFQARAGLEGQALLEVTVIEASDLKQKQKQNSDAGTPATPYAIIEIDPSVCVEECKRTSAPLSPQKSKRIAAAAAEVRNTMFSKRTQAEVSLHRTKLVKNEMRSEKSLEINPDKPVLKVEILTGHGLSPADMNGYSDPYCTLSITDRATGKAIDAEKKRTVVVSKTLNPVWTNESFVFGSSVPLSEARSLLIHVKDHNNIGRSTPLGRVEIPLYDVCRASADFTSISSKAVVKRYELKPEPWMKKHAKDLGELCIRTEVVGDATVLAELMQRVSTVPMEKSLSILSFSEANIQSEASMDINMSATDIGGSELEDETTEVIQRGLPIQTSTSRVLGTTATWRKEKFALSLSYPGVFSDAKYPTIETHVLYLRVHEARNLLLTEVAGNQNSIGSSTLEIDAVQNSLTNGIPRNTERAQDAANIYFTVIPVLGDGRLEDAERKQSLTVYNTRDPSWPEENFVFGKIKDIANVSYLSLHLYGRDLQNDQKEVLSKLLTREEKKQDARLKRFQLHKLAPSGEIDDDGFETLQYGQRVLAFRGGDDGGRFYPARVQKYIPFPDNAYDVHFEDDVDTIDELRNLISFDVKGAVQAVRGDGRVDVSVENDLPAVSSSARRTSRYTVKPTQLIPVNKLTDKVERVMARRFDMEKEEDERWLNLQHKLSGIVIDVLSASDLLVPVHEVGKPQKFKQIDKNCKPACRITWLGNPKQVASSFCRFNKHGELIPSDTVTLSNWNCEKGEPLAAIVQHGSAETDDVHLFQLQPLVIGRVDPTPPGDTDYQPIDAQEAKMGYQILEQASSILIRVEVNSAADSQTLGFVKVDLAMLQIGQQDLTLPIVPPEAANVPYYKFVGSLFLRITAWSDLLKSRQLKSSSKVEDLQNRLSVCGLNMWYQRQLNIEARSSSISTRGVTWIERRQTLRSSLNPTENCQIDELHAVLVVIMKRIVSILREIRQFEEFEVLSAEDMRKCRLAHTVNADPSSEWLGCTMDKLSLEVRKEVVVGLENELLDLAGVTGNRSFPKGDIPREEWVQLRADRQRLLRESGSFFMRDQTSALVLSVPRSFTGEGMISWILRCPPVLWKDEWTKYCRGSALECSCRLGWDTEDLKSDPDAIQAPTSTEYALQWLSALCAAGFVENVTPGIAAVTDLGKRQVLLENKADRFYRLREVDMWMEKLPRGKSLFPLDLVQEIDCYRAVDLPVFASVDESTDATSNQQEQQAKTKRNKTYAKKLTEHCDGFLGMHTMASSALFSPDARKNTFLHPVIETLAEKAEEYAENMLWDWKYCLLVPSRKHLYLYEQKASTIPVAFIDLASVTCKVAYNFTNDAKGGWMDIVNPTVGVRKPNSQDFVPIGGESLEKMTKTRANGDKVIEVKTPQTQKWIQALTSCGVCVDMRPGQMVLMKRLNPTVLQQKCIKHATEFDHNDLEGSFHRLLNCVFGHDKELSHQDHEKKSRELRAQVRSELKKPGVVGETVMAYYGKGKNLKSKPTYSGSFKKDSLYSGRILRIRTPFTDPTYGFKTKYDISNKAEVPEALSNLLARYKVTDKASWLSLPKAHRDMFLLYDVEYSHDNERIVEEGLMREHIRTSEGDLDPQKVNDRCTDLNILFKATDLENCVSRMVMHRYRHKPLGVLKIPIKMISPHRTVDAWYPLAPASDMLQKTRLGQIRVELKLVNKREIKRSAKIPFLVEAIKSEVSELSVQEKSLTPKSNSEQDLKKKVSFAVALEPSFIKVSILEGRSLRVADLFTSDPFVEIVLIDEEGSKERDTNLKTDIKMKTLNPKWENQEFLLGKTDKTMLRDKKAVLLRVMDYDQTSANDPLGCVAIEFQRSETGFIRGVVLKQADILGGSVMEELTLDNDGRVEVEAMLLPASGQSKPKAKKPPAPDGLLGKLRFSVEIMRNENYIDPSTKQLDTSFSAEIAIKDVDLKDENWRDYTCYLQPHGEGGLRIQYDPASEDLGVGNPHKFSDLLRQAAPLLGSDDKKAGNTSQASSFSVSGAFKILGRTYDLSKVDYFDVRLVSESQGKSFEGQLGKLDRKGERKSGGKGDDGKPKFSLKTPDQCANFRDEKLVLTDQDSKLKVTLTFDLNLIGILRADRVKRILADTFRLVGLVFDSRALNQNSGRYDPEQLQTDVHAFLWDTCRSNVFPKRNVADELLAQVRIMCHASKLHWKVTPQLLAYVFEIVFLNGEKDRLSYENTVALDALLNRWSRILIQVTEAKDYLTGHLHGKKTPRLIESLFTECEWTGFDFISLSGGPNFSNGGSIGGHHNNEERSSRLRVGDRATAHLPLLKHAGVPVDVQLPGGQFVAAVITKECGGDEYDINLCTELNPEETFLVCPLRDENDPEVSSRQVRDIKQGRLATLKMCDEKLHPDNPYLVEYLDHVQPHEEWQPRDAIQATLLRVEGRVLKSQLQKEDYVWVSKGSLESPEETPARRRSSLVEPKIDDGHADPTSQKSATNTEPTRPARIACSNGNARYDIVYLDGLFPKDEKLVARERLLPVSDGVMYDGKVTATFFSTGRMADSPSVIKYSLLLDNGELVEALDRDQLRTHQDFFAADTALLGSIFSSNLQTLDKPEAQQSSPSTRIADKLSTLWWGSDKVMKVYAMLPSPVKTIQVRDTGTNQLLQSALMERNDDLPRFIGQYHGFVKGENLDKAEEENLELVYTAACKRRTHNNSSNRTVSFSKKNCFYLIVAPPPLVQVRGAVTASSTSDSDPRFKALVLATLENSPDSIVLIFQRLLRAEYNIDPQPGHKGRTVMIESVKVELGSTPIRTVVFNPSDTESTVTKNFDLTGVTLSDAIIEIKFHVSIPHSDKGSLSDAVNVAFQHGTDVSERLKLKTILAAEGDGNLGKLSWALATSEELIPSGDMILSVDFTNQAGRFDSEPEVSLELEPLHDIRVSVRDFDENVHELHFRMQDVAAEAQIRRELAPFYKATVTSEPSTSSLCNLKFHKTSTNKSPVSTIVKVPRTDVKFDTLSVQVLEASNMTLKEKMGAEGLLVEVLLVSSDFQQHMANDRKITTPFGLALSSTGEILPDADKQIYPKNSIFSLANGKLAGVETKAAPLSASLTSSMAWKNKYAHQHDNQVKFAYPTIDLDRVSEVKLVVRDKKTKAKIGVVTIPMAKIGVSRLSNDDSKPKDEPIFSLHHEGSGKRRVVGTISLIVTRRRSFGDGAEVYAKQLERNMDFWAICPKELLRMTLEQRENKLCRSLLSSGPPVSGGGKKLLDKSLEMELQLQKITKVRLIFDAMSKLHSTLAGSSTTISPHVITNGAGRAGAVLTSLALDQLRLTLQQTKSLVKDTAHELGLIERRLPWSSDAVGDENDSQLRDNMVIVEANVATCTHRVRHTVLKLYELFVGHFMPKLNELYALDAEEDRVDVATGEKLLSFFNNEVDELEIEDQKVRQRLYQRLRLAKLTQVLDMILRATVRVKVMDEDRNNVDNYLGTACIPLVDLLDQQPRDDLYQLLYLPTTNLRGYRVSTQSAGEHDRGKVRLRLHLKLSESSFFEQAINVYKIWKAKYLAQHEAARRRLHAAVVPAQRRRWLTIQGYLNEITSQAKGKLHWERTPVLLSLVWDIFAMQEMSPTRSKKKNVDADELEYTQSVTKMANVYREAVMTVHKRWVNMQPRLDELMTIQASEQIHAQRTPELLDDIEREIEGLDVGLSTAWQQVKQKWQILLNALEQLVEMQERKLNLTRAPKLLTIVEKRCSKGLSTRHADAVSNAQSRWMAITQPNGPLSELRLMEKKGLHWRRTHELLLLLDEQCEGFADVDARALDTVQNRWEQVQEWLHEVVEMQQQHSIDCEHTPFILEKMHLWRSMRIKRQGEANKPEKLFNPIVAAPPSPKNKDDAGSRLRGLSHQNSSSRVSSDGSIRCDNGFDDNGQLEGMAEWYAIEEAKYELERIPYHRISSDSEKRNWLSYSRDGKDIRLLITQEEMVFTPANVRRALEDRGVIPKTSNCDDTNATSSTLDDAWFSPSLADPKSGSQSVALPKSVLKEIEELEAMLEKHRDDSQHEFAFPNPERVAELYQSMKSLGKSDLLWKVDHAVSRNRELAVPENYQLLLKEMTMRQIPTTEVENLVKSLAFTLQKEALVAKGIAVPTTANPTTLLQLMHRHQVKEVLLPQDTNAIQSLLQERGMDRKGDPVMLRGIRIGTQSTGVSGSTSGSSSKALNTGLGIIDTQIEVLRKTLLFEALRKRNSLVRTFAGESHVLDDENERTAADMFAAAVENAEVDVSGDYLTLVERFQRLIVHEAYTKRLAEYAALDRCVRALVGKSRDEVVTKEDIAMELYNINKRVIGANYRLPAEAFTKEELKQAVAAGRIRTPSDEMFARCPQGDNASAMAHYAAISYAANVFQEVTSFRSRVDLRNNRLQDTFPFDECSSLDGLAIPKQRSRWTFGQSIADWLLGFDTSTLNIKRKLSAAHRQRLEWASAAFTLRNRWLQRGLGWCDPAFGEGVGVKILLDRLLLFEAANKMDMVKTEKLLREVRDKCSRLREREQEAQAKLEERYQSNLELLEKLVTHAERCINNRKLHSEETPVLLHKLEQVCIVPNGLNERHREAYHKVATSWLPQQQNLTELVKMHREGTFSITRTPELLGKMNYHTEGNAGSKELSEDKVAASAQRVAPELQATFVDRKLNEVRLGQRKESSSLHLDLNTDEEIVNQSVEDTTWKELSHSKRVAQPLSPHEKHTSWKVVRNAVNANAAFSAAASSSGKSDKLKISIEPKMATQPASPRRKLSLSDELKEMLRSPSKWLTGAGPQEEFIKPELYFPKEVVLETPSASLTGADK